MEHGVEERRVHAEPVGVRVLFGGQPHLGEQVVAGAPQLRQAAEGGPVRVTEVREPVVHALKGLGHRTGGRPLPQLLAGAARDAGAAEDAGDMAHPRLVVGGRVAGPGVHAERAAAVGGRGAYRDLDADRCVGGQQQRRLQGQITDPVDADALAGGQGQLDEGGRGHQHPAADDVVREPRVGGGGEHTAEHQVLAAREVHGGGQQRVLRRGQAERPCVARTPGRQPVVLALEGVRRQVGGAAPGKNEAPSSGAPWTRAAASPRASVAASGRPARSRATVAAASPVTPERVSGARTASGPSSTNTVAPCASSSRTASRKRTAWRIWPVQ